MSSRPRVCFVTSEYPPAIGGLGRSAQRIVRLLAESGLDVHVFKPGHQVGYERADGATLYSVPTNKQRPPKGLVWTRQSWTGARPRYNVSAGPLRSFIENVDRHRDFDIFHGFGLWHAEPCVEVARRKRRPVILSIRGADGVALPKNRGWVRAVRAASWITSVSTQSIDRAHRLADIAGRCSFIPNGVDLRDVKRWVPSSANRGVVGTAAAFREKKNIPLLVRAYARLPERMRSRLLLVGGYKKDHTEVKVKKLIRELDLSREVKQTGFVPRKKVFENLLGMGVFVLSSNHEGMPNAILEAAAAGVPIVATAVDGVKDVLEHELNALLVPPRDVEAMSEAIQRVLEDGELALRLSAAAREVARELTPEAERRAYVKLYRRLLGKRA